MENDYEKKISCLENEISDLQVELKKEQEAFNEIMRIVSRFGDIMQSVISQNETFKVRFDNLPYELTDAIQRKLYWLPEIMTVEQTIEEIVTNHKSICRFGDGEIGIIYDQQRWKFQRCDMGLAERLKEVITSNEADIMIGINDFYGDLSHRSPEDRDPIRSYITPEIRMQHYELLQKGRTYANARISRNWTMQMVLNQSVYGRTENVSLLKENRHAWALEMIYLITRHLLNGFCVRQKMRTIDMTTYITKQ